MRCLTAKSSVWIGEVIRSSTICSSSHPQFNDLLFKRGQPCFFAFDALYADGKDFRRDALIERKIALRQVIQVYGEPASREIFAEHRLSDMKPQFIRSKRRSKRGRSRGTKRSNHIISESKFIGLYADAFLQRLYATFQVRDLDRLQERLAERCQNNPDLVIQASGVNTGHGFG